MNVNWGAKYWFSLTNNTWHTIAWYADLAAAMPFGTQTPLPNETPMILWIDGTPQATPTPVPAPGTGKGNAWNAILDGYANAGMYFHPWAQDEITEYLMDDFDIRIGRCPGESCYPYWFAATATPTPVLPCGVTAFTCATVQPTIDGQLSEWSGVTGYTIDNSNYNYMYPLTPTPSPADLSGTFYCGYDNVSLYLAGVITDTTVISPGIYSILNGDAAEIGVDALADGLYKPRLDDHELQISPDNKVRDYGIYPIESTSAISLTASGWQFEMSVSAANLGGNNATSGGQMCLAFGLTDNDTSAGSFWDRYLSGEWLLGEFQ